MVCTPGNGGGDQIQVGPSPFASVIGQASVGLVAAANGKHSQQAHYATWHCGAIYQFIIRQLQQSFAVGYR